MSPRWSRRDALIAAAALPLAACAKADAASIEAFKVAAARKGLVCGAAVDLGRLEQDADFAALVNANCAQITPENAMKWSALRPAAGVFDFARADQLLHWAESRRIAVYGHNLVWHEAMPDWLKTSLTAANGEALMRAHIDTVVGRYRGRIRAWDVVIEAIERADGRDDGLRQSPWFSALGPDYIAIAFRLAHAADPKARLAIADYGLEHDDIEWMVLKRRAMLDLLGRLKSAGVPIHALNIQSHLLGTFPPAFGEPLKQFLRAVADLGLDIYIGELDVSDRRMDGAAPERDQKVGDIYRRYLDVVLAEPAVKMLSTWGLSDRYNAKPDIGEGRADADDRPLPFDRDLAPKPAADAMIAALTAAPKRKALV